MTSTADNHSALPRVGGENNGIRSSSPQRRDSPTSAMEFPVVVEDASSTSSSTSSVGRKGSKGSKGLRKRRQESFRMKREAGDGQLADFSSLSDQSSSPRPSPSSVVKDSTDKPQSSCDWNTSNALHEASISQPARPQSTEEQGNGDQQSTPLPMAPREGTKIKTGLVRMEDADGNRSLMLVLDTSRDDVSISSTLTFVISEAGEDDENDEDDEIFSQHVSPTTESYSAMKISEANEAGVALSLAGELPCSKLINTEQASSDPTKQSVANLARPMVDSQENANDCSAHDTQKGSATRTAECSVVDSVAIDPAMDLIMRLLKPPSDLKIEKSNAEPRENEDKVAPLIGGDDSETQNVAELDAKKAGSDDTAPDTDVLKPSQEEIDGNGPKVEVVAVLDIPGSPREKRDVPSVRHEPTAQSLKRPNRPAEAVPRPQSPMAKRSTLIVERRPPELPVIGLDGSLHEPAGQTLIRPNLPPAPVPRPQSPMAKRSTLIVESRSPELPAISLDGSLHEPAGQTLTRPNLPPAPVPRPQSPMAKRTTLIVESRPPELPAISLDGSLHEPAGQTLTRPNLPPAPVPRPQSPMAKRPILVVEGKPPELPPASLDGSLHKPTAQSLTRPNCPPMDIPRPQSPMAKHPVLVVEGKPPEPPSATVRDDRPPKHRNTISRTRYVSTRRASRDKSPERKAAAPRVKTSTKAQNSDSHDETAKDAQTNSQHSLLKYKTPSRRRIKSLGKPETSKDALEEPSQHSRNSSRRRVRSLGKPAASEVAPQELSQHSRTSSRHSRPQEIPSRRRSKSVGKLEIRKSKAKASEAMLEDPSHRSGACSRSQHSQAGSRHSRQQQETPSRRRERSVSKSRVLSKPGAAEALLDSHSQHSGTNSQRFQSNSQHSRQTHATPSHTRAKSVSKSHVVGKAEATEVTLEQRRQERAARLQKAKERIRVNQLKREEERLQKRAEIQMPSVEERRANALEWHHRCGSPSRRDFKVRVAAAKSCKVTEDDVDLLEWNPSGSSVIVKRDAHFLVTPSQRKRNDDACYV